MENPQKYEELNSCFKQHSDDEKNWIQNSFKQEVAKLYGTSISQAVKNIILELNHAEFYVRYGAAEDLGKMGEADAVIPLIAVLNDNDPRLRSAVAQALGDIGDINAVEPLISVVKTDEDEQVKENAARALIKLRIFEGFDPIFSNFLKKCAELEPIEFVTLALDYKQEIIVNTLDWRELEEVIISGINHEHWEVKNIALSTLSEIGTSETLAKLIQIPEINIYDQEIFLLARKLAVRFSKEKAPFIPVYPELLGQSFDV
ncbi:HEAT repeat domain-containing protein [Anabaena sp. WFMT]|uniref:HEAT repeat domain-containing protein n=1 Tax=Anabaena sp. WFMT TaxID=3449730 RepID=UPI003F248DA7